MQNENNIRNIVKEVMRELNKKGVEVNENFVLYYILLLTLDPKWCISNESMTDRDHIHQFVQHVFKVLQNQNVPSIVTLKMQLYFSCNFEHSTEVLRYNHRIISNRLSPLKSNILKVWCLEEDVDVENLYKKIVYYITLVSGLGNPLLGPVYREALAALKSVMFKSELQKFIGDSKLAKEEQLVEITKIVTGVRLFNKDAGRSGEGIEDLPALLNDAVTSIEQKTRAVLRDVMCIVNGITSAIVPCFNSDPDKSTKIDSKENIEYLKDILIVYRQHEFFARKLIAEIDVRYTCIKTIFKNLQEKYKNLHEAVYMKIAIPAYIVFPKFIEIAEIWGELQDQTILLVKLHEINENLCTYVNNLNFDIQIIVTILGGYEEFRLITDSERFTILEDAPVIESDNPEILVHFTTDVKPEFHGFCMIKLVETQGGLIPGNPNLGIVVYKQRNYYFSSVEAGNEFLDNPELAIYRVLDLARVKPQLINFFQIKHLMMEVQHIIDLVPKETKAVITCDVEIETDDHIETSRFDSSYKWNVWDLKREALQLASISRCRTVGKQIGKSFNECPVRIQTHEYKEKGTQTHVDRSTSTPHNLTFIYGLRGRKDDKQFILDLKQLVKEDT